MDPNATLALWRTEKDPDDKDEFARILRIWIDRGGFEPEWTAAERAAIMGVA